MLFNLRLCVCLLITVPVIVTAGLVILQVARVHNTDQL